MTQTSNHGCYAGLNPVRRAVASGGVEWSYLEWTTARPQATLLLLHGITSTALSWWRVGPALAQQGLRVIAPDMPGHGDSSSMPTSYLVEETAQAIAAFSNTLDLGQVLLAGHSWGGANALAIAARQLLPITKVALLDPALVLRDRAATEKIVPNYTTMVGLPPDETLPKIRAANPTWDDCDVTWRAEALYKVRLEAVEGFFYSNTSLNLTEQFSQVSVPLLLLLGDPAVGGVVSSSMEQAAAAHFKSGLVKVEHMPGVGHNLHREAFGPFMNVFASFLLNNDFR